MTTTKITLDGSEFYIVPSGFEFVNQSFVKFLGFRLSKNQLITCCEYFIHLLQILGYSDRLKVGFNLKCFKYFELSVYLHGLVQLYCSIQDEEPLGELHITRFSRLPHDVMKSSKIKKDLEIVLVNDFFGGSFYVCSIDGVTISFHSLQGLKPYLYLKFPSLRDYDLNFVIK